MLKDKGCILLPILFVVLITMGLFLERVAPTEAKPEIDAIEKILAIEGVEMDFSEIEGHDKVD